MIKYYLLMVTILYSGLLSGETIDVLVMDTPIDFSHPELGPLRSEHLPYDLKYGETFFDLDGSIKGKEKWDHGTHVSGIIASQVDSSRDTKVTISSAIYFSPKEEEGQEEPDSSGKPCPGNQIGDLSDDTWDFSGISWENSKKDYEKTLALEIERLQTVLDKNGSRVVNMSWGESIFGTLFSLIFSSTFTQEDITSEELVERLNEMIRMTQQSYTDLMRKNPQTLFVMAAGNDGRNLDAPLRKRKIGRMDMYKILGLSLVGKLNKLPGLESAIAGIDLPNAIVVGAVDKKGKKSAKFSNFGDENVDVYAPGVDIVSTLPNNEHGPMTGTSMASPYVAGVAARLLQENPSLTADQVKKIILESSQIKRKLKGKAKSSGVADLELALDYLKSTVTE